jgi:hypothetical protein
LADNDKQGKLSSQITGSTKGEENGWTTIPNTTAGGFFRSGRADV